MLSLGNAVSQETDSNDEGEMDATMRLMGEAEAQLPDAVTKPITLPDAVLKHNSESPAVAASGHGMTTATAKNLHREEGLTKADTARANAAEMSEQAQNDRETHGRSEDRPDPPPPPENPDPPGGPPNQN